MRTTLSVAAFAAVMMGSLFPIGAAEKVSGSCQKGKSQIPALVRDAAKAAKVCPEDVVLVEDHISIFRKLGVVDPEKMAAEAAKKRAFVLGHNFPVYLNFDWEIKELVSAYEKSGDKFLLAFVASWLVHELVHIRGVDEESPALQEELSFLLNKGIAESDPNIQKLKKRVSEAKASERLGKTQTILLAVAAAPTPPPGPRPVEAPMPEPRPAGQVTRKGDLATVTVALANE